MNTHDNVAPVPFYFNADQDETHYVTVFTDEMKAEWEHSANRTAYRTIISRDLKLGRRHDLSFSDADATVTYYYLFNVDMLLAEERHLTPASIENEYSTKTSLYRMEAGSWTLCREITERYGEVINTTAYRNLNNLIHCPISYALSRDIAAKGIQAMPRPDLVIPARRIDSGYWDIVAQAFEVMVVSKNQAELVLASGVDGELADSLSTSFYSDVDIKQAEDRIDSLVSGLAKVAANRVEDFAWCEGMAMHLSKVYAKLISHINATSNRMYGNVFLTNMRNTAKVDMSRILEAVSEGSSTCGLHLIYEHLYGALSKTYRLNQGEIHAEIESILNDVDAVDYDWATDQLRDMGFTTCTDCGEWEADDNVRGTYNSDEDSICRECIDSHYTFSDYHDAWLHNDTCCDGIGEDGNEVYFHTDCDDFSYNDDDGVYYHYNYERGSKLINSYHTAKNRGLYKKIQSDWTARNNRFMGIELEVEIRSRDTKRGDIAERLNAVLNDGAVGSRAHFEEDGSLTSGFEIITNPMGLDTHTEFWTWLQDKDLIRGLRSHDTSTCGLHIHVSRRGMNRLQIAKINTFVNHPDNAELISKVARRYSSSYARISQKKLSTAYYEADRYDAVNLNNSQTIEFRIFKGTLKYESLMAAVEFVNAVVNFTMPASPAGFNLSTERFMRFIESFPVRGETKFLRSYLQMAADEDTDKVAA
jgi:hypothetical protein